MINPHSTMLEKKLKQNQTKENLEILEKIKLQN